MFDFWISERLGENTCDLGGENVLTLNFLQYMDRLLQKGGFTLNVQYCWHLDREDNWHKCQIDDDLSLLKRKAGVKEYMFDERLVLSVLELPSHFEKKLLFCCSNSQYSTSLSLH